LLPSAVKSCASSAVAVISAGSGQPPQGQPNGRRGHTEPSCRTHLRSLTEALRALGASASSLLARRANDDDQQSNTIASRCIV